MHTTSANVGIFWPPPLSTFNLFNVAPPKKIWIRKIGLGWHNLPFHVIVTSWEMGTSHKMDVICACLPCKRWQFPIFTDLVIFTSPKVDWFFIGRARARAPMLLWFHSTGAKCATKASHYLSGKNLTNLRAWSLFSIHHDCTFILLPCFIFISRSLKKDLQLFLFI